MVCCQIYCRTSEIYLKVMLCSHIKRTTDKYSTLSIMALYYNLILQQQWEWLINLLGTNRKRRFSS
jgi:hypothetical protein